jgi:hypothetical protein
MLIGIGGPDVSRLPPARPGIVPSPSASPSRFLIRIALCRPPGSSDDLDQFVCGSTDSRRAPFGHAYDQDLSFPP